MSVVESQLKPLHIKESHWNEWTRDSIVDPLLTSLSIVSLEGLSIYDRLFVSNELPRLNGGRVSSYFYNKYFPLENGGWWCNGVDVLNDFEPEIWGQFKGDTPRSVSKSKLKSFGPIRAKSKEVKYEPPPKLPTSIFALPVPLHLWQAIARRHNIPLPENITVTPQGRALGFWAWIMDNPKIPLIVTEGAKKAACLITAEYVAIALPGIYNGYRQPKDDYGNKIGSAYLIPQLKAFAQKDREIILCFDNDSRPKTAKNVQVAISITGKLFESSGCKVSVISWNYPEKGVDDLISARGVDYFGQLYKNRSLLTKFKLRQLLSLDKFSPLIINQRYLEESLTPPADAQLIGIKSSKGTGKTERLAKIVHQAIGQGRRAIVLCHREQLAIALAERFGIDYRTEVKTSITKGALGYTLCVDSLHKNANPSFNPDEWTESLVIVDEAEQVFWHMLDSSTCRANRVNIIESFKQLLNTALTTGGQVYLADADLSPIAIDYVRSLIDLPIKVWVVKNQYNPNQGKRRLISYSGNDPRELVAELVQKIEDKHKVLIHTTAQKAKSKWGSTNLESYLAKKFPQKKILRIDSESVAQPGHPALGCMAYLNAILPNYDIVICSPVLETGISIDIKRHFDSVWAIAGGVQTVDAVCQEIERLRDDVPRHIWVKTTAKGNRIGNGSTSIKGLLASQHKLTALNIKLLQQAGIPDFDELEVNFAPGSLNTWAKRTVVINSRKTDYRASILSKLVTEGYELVEYNRSEDREQFAIINEGLKETRTENYQAYIHKVPKMAMPTNKELENLKNKRAKTPEERLTERKGNLSKRYGIEVTPELVEKDDDGCYGQLQLLYFLTVGNIYLAARDRRSLSKISEQGEGSGFKPDINKKQLSGQIKALELLNISQFLDPQAEFTKQSLAEWLEFALLVRFDIKTLLGISINPEKDSPIAVAQRFLKKLGLKLKFKFWRGDRKNKQRVYSGCQVNVDWRKQIFDYWLSKEKV